MKDLKEYLNESIYADGHEVIHAPRKFDKKVFIIVKPGFLQLAPKIINMYQKQGFKLFQQRPKQLLKNEAASIYRSHKDEDWYNALCKYMASDVSIGITFTYDCSTEEAFKKCDELKDKIREKWQEDDKRNVMHSSDNQENMERESSFYV